MVWSAMCASVYDWGIIAIYFCPFAFLPFYLRYQQGALMIFTMGSELAQFISIRKKVSLGDKFYQSTVFIMAYHLSNAAPSIAIL
ncbi:MAG TPA: hypothetical protein DEV38_00585 [Psychrobacter sp.]|nr:hypothetical protein [Psychrobacter sp.]